MSSGGQAARVLTILGPVPSIGVALSKLFSQPYLENRGLITPIL